MAKGRTIKRVLGRDGRIIKEVFSGYLAASSEKQSRPGKEIYPFAEVALNDSVGGCSPPGAPSARERDPFLFDLMN